jgi:hypothetical protein
MDIAASNRCRKRIQDRSSQGKRANASKSGYQFECAFMGITDRTLPHCCKAEPKSPSGILPRPAGVVRFWRAVVVVETILPSRASRPNPSRKAYAQRIVENLFSWRATRAGTPQAAVIVNPSGARMPVCAPSGVWSPIMRLVRTVLPSVRRPCSEHSNY